MGIEFSCDDCGNSFAVVQSWAGKRVKCRACGHTMRVPGDAAPTPLKNRTVPQPPAPSLDHPPQHDDEPIPLIVWQLVGGILVIGLIACAWVMLSNRSQPVPIAIVAPPSVPLGQESPAQTAPIAAPIAAPIPAPMPPIADTPPVSMIHFPDRRIRLRLPGVEIYPMHITGTGPGIPMHIRLYLPLNRHEPHSLPCVFIAPAGTRMLYGSALGNGDTPEHLPYARAGFAVLAYELSGDVPDDQNGRVTFGKLRGPVQQFMAADGGLANTRTAVDFVLSKVPEVDPDQLFAAGHSSAATMALNAVESDHRFRAVAAYAPACDVVARWGSSLSRFDHFCPGAADLAARVSPILHVSDIACPVLLFHADDDQNVSISDVSAYVTALQSAGKTVDFQKVPTGGHYQSMIDQGIPAGIAFFKSHGAKPLPPILH